MNINKLISPYNHYNGRSGQSIQYIVIHYVGALGGAKENCQYYASGDVGASAHYYVGFAGEIWQSVEDANGAWSVGGGLQGSSGASCYGKATNYNTLNIEMCVRKGSTATMSAADRDWYFEDATVKSAVELTKMLMQKYNIPVSRVIRHYDVNGKTCPNPYVYNHSKHTWDAFKTALSENAPSKPSVPENPDSSIYRVQTGAYKDKKLAAALEATLKAKGYDTILKKDGGYHKVQVGAFNVKSNAQAALKKLQKDGYDAFITGTEASYTAWVGKCTADNVNVRTGPGTGYAPAADYPQIFEGNLVDVTGEQTADRKWYLVRIAGNVTGYVAAEYIQKA